MKLRELLETDWTVDRLYISMRTSSGRMVARYYIGPDMKPSKYAKWRHTAKAGDVYDDNGIRVLIIDRIIQLYHYDRPYKGNKSVGVMLEEIPGELLELDISRMAPVEGGRGAYGWHGYRVTCISDLWVGISGEDAIVEGNGEEAINCGS